MKQYDFTFDKVIIIESLPEDEMAIRNGTLMSSGKYYTDVLFPYCNQLKKASISYEYFDVNREEDFLSCLDEIRNEINRTNSFPIIHFEIHGRDKEDGMTLKNGDFIDWETIINKLRLINIATCNNLLVVFATCSGAHNIKGFVTGQSPFPYHTAIAPDNQEYPILMEQKYSFFYIDLIISRDIGKAFYNNKEQKGKANSVIFTCEHHLYEIFKKETNKRNANFDNKVREFVEILKREGSHEYLSEDELYEMIANRLKDPELNEVILKSLKDKHLMASIPENKDRFLFSAQDIINTF